MELHPNYITKNQLYQIRFWRTHSSQKRLPKSVSCLVLLLKEHYSFSTSPGPRMVVNCQACGLICGRWTPLSIYSVKWQIAPVILLTQQNKGTGSPTQLFVISLCCCQQLRLCNSILECDLLIWVNVAPEGVWEEAVQTCLNVIVIFTLRGWGERSGRLSV